MIDEPYGRNGMAETYAWSEGDYATEGNECIS